jgi:hypothetical protein
MATRMLTDLSGRPKPFEVTGDAHQVSLNWTAWLEEFEAYADSIGLFIAEDADENKQQRRAMLLYIAGKQVRDNFKTSRVEQALRHKAERNVLTSQVPKNDATSGRDHCAIRDATTSRSRGMWIPRFGQPNQRSSC